MPLADAWPTRAGRESAEHTGRTVGLRVRRRPLDAEGFDRVEEAQLHYAPRLLPPQDCEALSDRWLAEQSNGSQTPNWDIASTCTVGGYRDLLLVEAKAQDQELKIEDRIGGSRANIERIAKCIEEANCRLAPLTSASTAVLLLGSSPHLRGNLL